MSAFLPSLREASVKLNPHPKCLEKFPALRTDFEDGWPVQIYYLKYAYKRAHNESYKKDVQKPNPTEKRRSHRSRMGKQYKDRELPVRVQNSQ